ncbi:CrcB protein [Thermosporothrix hazakensis]|jgi:CrcB protein|uniref:Fluoride-specific ion channel FluC n=2 Tax=Thermosporothrix TaxID=768650 RepID=A0A326U7Q7_THEHA|nr:fluoride efflux transporter CrcB [Thermosporothrix hazakensis]PZW29215.1 CrcB protein [Thermosporothrix hazakensis]BBH86145.1 putative fluoride ion transporter CrcB [Thermosporothrix sp. COM3]GCE45433.1 putative fluoride ion transporter CrcB [Thermosporothrix hazakensis]
MTFASLLLTGGVGLAGALGAVARYLLGSFISEHTSSAFPSGTLIINVSGAFVIGLIFAFTSRGFLSAATQTVLATGFLGGYTTFSTMSWEAFQLMRGALPRGLLYLGLTYVLGLGAEILGLLVGRAL